MSVRRRPDARCRARSRVLSTLFHATFALAVSVLSASCAHARDLVLTHARHTRASACGAERRVRGMVGAGERRTGRAPRQRRAVAARPSPRQDRDPAQVAGCTLMLTSRWPSDPMRCAAWPTSTAGLASRRGGRTRRRSWRRWPFPPARSMCEAQQMANDPSMFEMTDASEALSAAIDHAREFGAVARRTNSGGDAMDEEMGDREISPRRQLEEIHAGGAEAEVSEEEPLVDGDEAEEKEKEEEEEEEPEGREPLFDMMLSTKIGGSIRFERTASAGEDEEDMPDFTLTLGLEQHFGSVPPTPGSTRARGIPCPSLTRRQESAPQTPAAHVPVPEIPTQAVVPPSPTSMGVAAEPSSSPVATSAESPEAEPSEATPEESKPVQPAEPQLTFEEKRALAREKGKQKAREREAAKLKEQQAEQPDEADEAETDCAIVPKSSRARIYKV
eukprot:2332931-Rhodomonas_salina.5